MFHTPVHKQTPAGQGSDKTLADYYSGTALVFTDNQETYVTESVETLLKMLPPSSR